MAKTKPPKADPKTLRENTIKQFTADVVACRKIAELIFPGGADDKTTFAIFDRVDLSDMPEDWEAIADRMKVAIEVSVPLVTDRAALFEVYDRLYTEDDELIEDAPENMRASVKIVRDALGEAATLEAACGVYDRLFSNDEDDEDDE